ncbi:hypothetical protein Aros01_07264 [Streptosporangium roseum]|uniref:Phosphatidic acid phosphatase type 2/haloperoxidase domain-containing protein n=2 Tax=Streptosporangium roseum TaxID=2001 RepID=D2AU79_STRRD|nr:hypothetical protein Sros_7872 [Streptosporangium roseum DSM 43021]
MGLGALIESGAPVPVVEVMVTLLVMLGVLTDHRPLGCVLAHRDRGRLPPLGRLRLGPAAAAGVGVIAVSAWARVRLGEHTPAQTVVGAALGAATAATVLVVAS